MECKHEGVRYPCLECEYISNGRSDLRKHVRNKHEGVRYPCHICTYAATRHGDLKRHMERKHKGEIQFFIKKKKILKINLVVDRNCYFSFVKNRTNNTDNIFYLLYSFKFYRRIFGKPEKHGRLRIRYHHIGNRNHQSGNRN